MRKHLYNLKTREVNLESVDNLRKNLGVYDVLSEYIILSLRIFHKVMCIFPQRIRHKLVTYLAKKFNVNLNGSIDINDYDYIYLLYFPKQRALLQQFVTDFVNEINVLIDPNLSVPDQNEYNELRSELQKIGINPNIPDWIINVLDYYRYSRNGLAHSNNSNIEKSYNKINIADIRSFYPKFVNALLSPGVLTIDDYYLYSASIKHFANLCLLSLNNNIPWNNIGKTHPLLTKSYIFLDQAHHCRFIEGLIYNKYHYILSSIQITSIINDMMASNCYYKNDIPKFSMYLQSQLVSYDYEVESEDNNGITLSNSWLMPCDEKCFDLQTCIKSFNEVYVSQYFDLKINQIVYIYSSNYYRVKYKFKVVGVDIPYSTIIDREECFYTDNREFQKAKSHNRYCLLQYLFTTSARNLSNKDLKQNGLEKNIKGCINLLTNSTLYTYIKSNYKR